MPSFNLPEFSVNKPTRTASRHRRSSASRNRPMLEESSKPPPAPPAIIVSHHLADIATQGPPPLQTIEVITLKNPAIIQLRGTWFLGRDCWRSPLALVSSAQSASETHSRLKHDHLCSQAQRPPSRRFIRVVPAQTVSPVTSRDLSNVSMMFSRRSSDGTIASEDRALWEEMIAASVERRLREKALRSKVGERAGLGVCAGREMQMLAALGTVRERRMKETLRQIAAPISAPPTRQSFSIETSPLVEDPPSAVRLARALGHRKSASIAGTSVISSSSKLGQAVSLGLPSSMPTLGTIQRFIARRSASAPCPSLSVPLPVTIVPVAGNSEEDEKTASKGNDERHPKQQPATTIFAPPLDLKRRPPLALQLENRPLLAREVTAPETDQPPPPLTAPPTHSTFPTRRRASNRSPSLASDPFALLPAKPPKAAQPSPSPRRHTVIGATTLPTRPPVAHTFSPVQWDVPRSRASGPNPPRAVVQQAQFSPPPTPPIYTINRQRASVDFYPSSFSSFPSPLSFPRAVVPKPVERTENTSGRTRTRSCATDSNVRFGDFPRRVAFA